MKVIVATALTQGQRDDDFNFCQDGELVILPAMTCSNAKADDECGCARALGGVSSHAGTTSMLVTEVEMTEAEWRAAVVDAYVAEGWFANADDIDAELLDDNRRILESIRHLPEGTVLGFRDGVFCLRATTADTCD
jgi:hypothetical protein